MPNLLVTYKDDSRMVVLVNDLSYFGLKSAFERPTLVCLGPVYRHDNICASDWLRHLVVICSIE